MISLWTGLAPVLASAVDPADLLSKAAGFGTALVVLSLVVRGVFRLDREVKSAEERAQKAEDDRDKAVAAADRRTDVERARADREAESRAQMQDTVSGDLAPALLRIASSEEQQAKQTAAAAELMEGLIKAVLRVVEKP